MKNSLLLLILLFVSVWSAGQEEQALFSLEKHTAVVKCLAWSPDGKILATGSEDKKVILWDATSGLPLQLIETGHLRAVLAMAFTPDGKKLITAGDRTLAVWTLDGVKEKVLGTAMLDIWSISISDDGKFLAAGSYDKKIRVWNLETGSVMPPLEGHLSSALSVCFAGSNNQLVSGSLDETIKVWDLNTSKILKTLKGHSGNIYSIARGGKSGLFVSASKDNSLRLWDLQHDQSLKSYTSPQPVMSVSMAREGRWMLSGSLDNTVTLRETYTGNKIYSYIGFKGGINAVAFSPDGSCFAVASGENSCRLYKTNPALFVNFYYEKEVTEELNASPLFAPKGKDEARADYKIRQDKAEELRRQVVARYFEKYLEQLAKQGMDLK